MNRIVWVFFFPVFRLRRRIKSACKGEIVLQIHPVYPPALQQKVLSDEAPGGTPAALNLVIPSITEPGRPFALKVAVLDREGYPSIECENILRATLPDGTVRQIPFTKGTPAVGILEGIKQSVEGFFRISATCGELKDVSNPSFCTSDEQAEIYWGDPHVHTILSRCHADKCRSLNFCYTAARYMSALDWVAPADHVSNGRCDFSKWKEQRTVAELYNDPGAFVTIPAYEASLRGGAGGDNNVYMAYPPEMFIDDFEEGTIKTLCSKLSATLEPGSFFVAPHHTTRTDKHGEIPDEIYPGAELMPLVEIHSKWGTSEYRGNPNPLKKVHGGPSFVSDFLKRGMQFGFMAGTDSHATMPSGGGYEPDHIDRLPGLTAVLSENLSRQSVFDALKNRSCYAASLERIIMLGSIAGRNFGEEVLYGDLAEAPVIDMMLAGKSAIERVDVVRNGITVHTAEPDSWNARIVYQDKENPDGLWLHSQYMGAFIYYYVRVTCRSGAQAWSSPVWIRKE